jgi:large subunit ribosomal protein L25
MQIEIIAAKREGQGTSASRRLRRAGKVPGIVYGEGKDAEAIEMDHNALWHQLKHEAAHSSVLSLSIDGAKQPVLLRDMQFHPYKQQILHVDFNRVSADHKIHMKVPLHFLNAETCPGVKLHGGVVSHVMTEVDISCLPSQLPEYIEVDLSALDTGISVHLSHLKMPAGVELVALHRGDDPTVATILGAKGGDEGEATAEGGATGAA